MTVATFAMAAGTRFEWHTHLEHQIAWAPKGVLTVVTAVATWVLPPTKALWIPAGAPHETLSSGPATMRALYIRPGLCPVAWSEFTPVAVSRLLVELIEYLGDPGLDGPPRTHAESLLADLLSPAPVATIEVRLPRDERAREVAQALAEKPADRRTLREWGLEVGASERTLARAFLADTGVAFGRWRTLVRLQAALPALASGQAVGRVARLVGYDSTSAFVAAFRRETAMTPMTFVQGQRGG